MNPASINHVSAKTTPDMFEPGSLNSFSRMFRRIVSSVLCSLMFVALAEPGSAADLAPDRKPVTFRNSLGMMFREVPGTPALFSIWETRVADWTAFLADSGYKWEYKPHFPQTETHPVVNISLRDAAAFCAWLTEKEHASGKLDPRQFYRLPTNKEWDAAAGLASGRMDERATTQKVADEQSFPWGMEWPPPRTAGNLNFAEIDGSDDGFTYTSPVGVFRPSPEGLYDLAGNAWEWAWDADVKTDSNGTLRGGSWMYFKKECLLSGYRYQVPPDLHAPSVGFRCVLEDKNRTADFLAKADAVAKESEKQKRSQLTTRPGVDAEEVQKMKEKLANRPEMTPAVDLKLPDPKSLKIATAGGEFLNALGMNFVPAGTENVLVAAHETRMQDYQAFLVATKKTWDRKPSFDVKNDHPIINVTWTEAREFCQWLTGRDRETGLIPPKARYRLPKDSEWSTAAGLKNETGDSPSAKHLANRTDYPWGQESVPPIGSGNFDSTNMRGYQDNFTHTAPVGSFSPNAFRIFDLAGNVAEWCEDEWPGSDGERVVRGSSWLSSDADALLTSARRHLPESAARTDVGFRCVLEIPAP